ncbi:hypothetical protein VTH82DRAFT_238 [Thermothelomyces myriococcoides]
MNIVGSRPGGALEISGRAHDMIFGGLGYGLSMSFDMMVNLTAARGFYWIDDNGAQGECYGSSDGGPDDSGSRTTQFSGLSVGISAVTGLPAQVGGSVNSNWTFINNIQRFTPREAFNQAISDECDKTALVFDNSSKTGYLVPKLSLLLHLCRAEAHRQNRTQEDDNTIPQDLPAAEVATNGYEAARKALMQHWNTEIIGAGSPAAQTLDQVLIRIHQDVMNAGGIAESSRRRGMFDRYVPFAEARAILVRPDKGAPLSILQSPAPLSWARVATLADAAMICSDLGPAIRPARTICRSDCPCNNLPHGGYLLAAHMWALARVVSRYGGLKQLERGQLDFGDGYVMRLSESRLWVEEGPHQHEDDFWEVNSKLIHLIEDEKRREYYWLREMIQGSKMQCFTPQSKPTETGVMVFGLPPDALRN